MSAARDTLGGRLPLADRDSLAPAQRDLFDEIVCAILNAFEIPVP